MPETDDKLKPGDLARALTAVVPEGSAAALVDTSAEASKFILSWLDTQASSAPDGLMQEIGASAAKRIRALLAKSDDLYRDNQRLFAERQKLEDQCVALRDERDALQAALDAINMESTNADR